MAVLLAALVVLSLYLTATCLFGDAEHTFSGDEILPGSDLGHVILPGVCNLMPGGCRVEIFEEGRAMGPRVSSPRAIRGAGAYAFKCRGWPSAAVLYFSATDGTDPWSNGKHYVVRYPRRQLPSAIGLLVVCWSAVCWIGRRYRWSLGAPSGFGRSISTAEWSVWVGGAIYSVFAAQAWLPAPSGAWFVAIAAAGSPLFLARVSRLSAGWRRPGLWALWGAGLLTWMGLTTLGPSPYVSTRTFATIVVVAVWGLVLLAGARSRLTQGGRSGAHLLFALLIVVSCLSLARGAGFELDRAVAAVGLSQVWAIRVVNTWTTKFLAQWFLVVGWCAVAAIGVAARRRGASVRWIAVAAIGALGTFTIGLAGSKTGIVALIGSVTVAAVSFRWPRPIRRLVVVGLIAVLLAAPWLAAVPWRAFSSWSSASTAEVLAVLELGTRGSIWEFTRRWIVEEPLGGWGIGAAANLPVQGVSVERALGGTSPPVSPVLLQRTALPGGHPHDAALLIWLELGLLGALLVAGLLWAIGRSIAATEEDKLTHASLLGLVTVNACFFAFNYPVWRPEILSILWMSAVLAAAVLPRRTAGRVELRWSAIVILVVLVLGGGLLGQRRLGRWLAVHELRQGPVVLQPDRTAIVVRDRARPLRFAPRFGAGAKLAERVAGHKALIRGWAYAPDAAGGADLVLVFVGRDLAGVGAADLPSPEAFRASHTRDVRALVSGFVVDVDPAELELDAPVTVVALQAGTAWAKVLPPLSGGAASEPAVEPGLQLRPDQSTATMRPSPEALVAE